MRKSPKYSPEVVERAVRMVFEAKDQSPPQWAAIESISAKIGCTAETLRRWVRHGERAAAAVRAVLRIDVKDALEQSCPARAVMAGHDVRAGRHRAGRAADIGLTR